MPFIEYDDVIEHISPAVSNPPLRNAVLPRTAEARSLRLNAKTLEGIDDFFIELRTAIKDQVERRGVVGECLAQLLDHPGAGRMSGHMALQNPPPVMGDDKEAIEHSKSQRRHGEEVH